MDLEIKPLTPNLADDYIRFFADTDSYADDEWSYCYCMHYLLDNAWYKENVEVIDSLDSAAMALEFVKSGRITGYLAYQDGKPVGWCAANAKKNYPRLIERKDLWSDDEPDKTLAIVCFAVSRPCRKQGVASALLEFCMVDAKTRGYDAIEAYPQMGAEPACKTYHGFASMYEQRGFKTARTLDDWIVMRKML
ncbi:MAG: GNAT family N-acetyltransferase [Clostridiales bacterium]|jgi:ribosomal protein S18 acetylase RimI-like enzyme|nr:GNAT family N-acetyltransferase [Clostridiales bacterium]